MGRKGEPGELGLGTGLLGWVWVRGGIDLGLVLV